MKKSVLMIIFAVILTGCNLLGGEAENNKIDVEHPTEHNNFDYPLNRKFKTNTDYSYELLYEYDKEKYILYFSILKDDEVVYESDTIIVDQLLENEVQYRANSGFSTKENENGNCTTITINVELSIETADGNVLTRNYEINKDSENNDIQFCDS